MTIPKSSFITTLAARGFLHQCTDLPAIDAHCCVGPVKAMISFDLDGDGLHAGHLLDIMVLRWLQRTGHKPVVLIGRAAEAPSHGLSPGPSASPVEIDPRDEIAAARAALSRFLTFGDGPTDALLVHRAGWHGAAGSLSILGEYAAHIPVNRILAGGSVRARLERGDPVTLRDCYDMASRVFDFLALARRENCLLQLGGSDQWGGILDAIELARRIDRRQLFGLTTPFCGHGAGTRIGGVPADAVRLDAGRLDPIAFRDHWRATNDADVPRFLRLYTELPLDEVARLTGPGGPGTRESKMIEAKMILADEVTRLVHGREAARERATAPRPAMAQEFGEGSRPSGPHSGAGAPRPMATEVAEAS